MMAIESLQHFIDTLKSKLANERAENAHLQEHLVAAVERGVWLWHYTWKRHLFMLGAEVERTDRTERERDGYKALAELRGEALMEYGNHHSSCILEHYAPGVRDCGCGYVAALRAAIAIMPEEAREKESSHER